MKANYRFIYLFALLLSSLLISCDEEGEGPGGEETPEQAENSEMYFPPVGSDEWETVTPAEIGWDTANFNEAIRFARDNRSANLMIIHKGRIVAEEYWRQSDATTQHELNSVAKSMMGFVIGVLQENGTINIHDKVSAYLPAGWSQSPNTEGDITIQHLLTMTSGLNEDLQFVGRPGEVWRYSHAAYKILYDVIKAATGGSARDYFGTALFSRIGMKNYTWTGLDLSSSARDIAKFGLMILNRGEWNGEKLLKDDGYFTEMLTTSQSLQEAYGYLWWLNGAATWYDDDTKTTHQGPIAGTMPEDSWVAKGFHDQRIYIVPSLELIVIRQGGISGLPEAGEGSFDAELWKRLMNAINAGALPN